jgi:hypothetical protein
MGGSGLGIAIMGLVALLASIANLLFNKHRKQWGFSGKFLSYFFIVISSLTVIWGLLYAFKL